MFNSEERNSRAESSVESFNKVMNIILWEGAAFDHSNLVKQE